MTKYLLLILICQLLLLIDITAASLENALHNYETLHHDTFKHHIKKRDIYTRDPEESILEFDTLGRHFNLILHQSSSVVADDLKVISIDENNVEKVVKFRPNIYHGYLADEPDSSLVNAYWEDENTLVASIRTSSDVYAIEPSWRHLQNSSEYSMISYRGSDLNMENDLGKHFCGYVREGDDLNQMETIDDQEKDHIEEFRFKRSSPCTQSYKNPVCRLILVADYRFYSTIGGSNMLTTTTYLLGLIDKINNIYGETSFGNCGTGFGFEVKEIRIHQAYTDGGADGNFNMNNNAWDTNTLLEMFSRDSHFKDFCLSHLFTAIPFSNGVLGLAYIGGSRPYSVGGVCSLPYFKGGYQLNLNTGWSSSKSSGGRTLLTLEYLLVTAHEFGHNWGSEHDPDTSECSPQSSAGGKHIMYTYSVSGMETNNKLFSPCSRRSMGAVLEAKGTSCFKERSGGFCGNSKVESGEDCDPGPNTNDPCCDTSCHLRTGKICSDSNDVCCRQCTYADSSTVCEQQQGTTCQQQSYCSGSGKSCPTPLPLRDGTSCNAQNTGYCSGGSCLSFCEYNKKYSCICDEAEKACHWCCRDTLEANRSMCVPYGNRNLPSGTPCFQGSCNDRGQCEKIIGNNIARLWTIIEHVTVSQLVMFMRANIVGTIIVLSLVIWIPVCCIISYADFKWKNQTKHKKLISEDFASHPPQVKSARTATLPGRSLRSRDSGDRKPLLM